MLAGARESTRAPGWGEHRRAPGVHAARCRPAQNSAPGYILVDDSLLTRQVPHALAGTSDGMMHDKGPACPGRGRLLHVTCVQHWSFLVLLWVLGDP